MVHLQRTLLLLSTAVFALTGFGYLVAPALMLSIVGIDSGATTDFLLRTEGVALACAAGMIWASVDGGPRHVRIVLLSLAAYYIVGSLLDLAGFAQGVVGPASVPSGAVRILVGIACIVAVSRGSNVVA